MSTFELNEDNYTAYNYGFTFRTWQLLLDMEVSRFVDAAGTESGNHVPDEVKRIVRSFLPRFPDGVPRLVYSGMEVYQADWQWRVVGDNNDTGGTDNDKMLHFRIRDYSGLIKKGNCIWVAYSPIVWEFIDLLDDGNGSDTGIAEIVFSSDSDEPVDGGSWIRASIRQFIPFERFFEYFDDILDLGVDELLADNDKFGSFVPPTRGTASARVWYRHEDGVLGIDITAGQGDFYWMEWAYRQQNSQKWVHAYSISEWWYETHRPRIGMSFLSEENISEILQSFREKGVDIVI